VVGAPIKNRAWVVPEYISHLARACAHANVVPDLIFIAPRTDPTIGAISKGMTRGLGSAEFILTDEDPDDVTPGVRNWGNPGRLHEMVGLRNRLIRRVREIAPDYFLSLDSDLLLAEDTLSELLRAGKDAVGLRSYMGPVGTATATHGRLVQGRQADNHPIVDRDDIRVGLRRTDVVMAGVLMGPRAYAIEYAYDRSGEDVGWALSAKAAGVELWFCADARAKHCMRPEDLGVMDPRVGW
jgi:hypothetical protein